MSFEKVSDWLWEIPKTGEMRVPARIYTSETMLKDLSRDRTIQQLINVAALPGIKDYALAMPDAHEGYGFPIGGVAATLLPDGIISPGAVGYDINCGVRLLASQLPEKEIKDYLKNIIAAIYTAVPSGVGKGGQVKLNNQEIDQILSKGAKRVVELGQGSQDDLLNTESNGSLKEADPALVSAHAKERGRDQLGTLGAGNHFIEIDRVEEVFRPEFGLFPGQIVVLIHTGSRGLGHQVATEYIKLLLSTAGKHHISLPDNELACAPFSSSEGNDYFQAMSAAANFAWANRQSIAWQISEVWRKILGTNGGQLTTLYDVAHNIAKIEEHDGQRVLVHRKGATRAFPGQPVIIPGSMGTASYVFIGDKELNAAFGSSCHGAGRRLSRHAALKAVNGRELRDELEGKGITVETGSLRGLAEEAPQAYKDINSVVEVVEQAGLAKKVAKLKPLAVIKG